MVKYQNPIIRGFNPDPSICRVGEDFYLVTSSFEFFPGVPVYHSRNLIDWELINYCLLEDDQLDLKDCPPSGGIYAPTLRYHDGMFYMITTNVSHKGNFIVYTDDIYGKWSKPQWIDQQGIDPSLLFDDDGKVYFAGTNSLSPYEQGIVIFEMNPLTGERLSEKKIVTTGCGGKYPEGPHLYHINGSYYLMLAEGGTEYGHMVTMLRGNSPYGPFVPCPHNPILSHKDFMGSPIQATGHADLIEDQNGNWWMVCLGIRPIPGHMLHNLGRETFLTPVVWENGWPVVGNHGRTALELEGSLPGPAPKGMPVSFTDSFDSEKLDLRWNYVRNPKRDHYQLKDHKLWLHAGDETLNDYHPTFLGARQQEFELTAQTSVSVSSLPDGGRAGISAYYNMDYHYDIYLTKESGKYKAGFSNTVHGAAFEKTLCLPAHTDELELRIVAGKERYRFLYRLKDNSGWTEIGSAAAAGLCTEGTERMSFTGTYLGMFAVRCTAAFDSFSVEESSARTNCE